MLTHCSGCAGLRPRPGKSVPPAITHKTQLSFSVKWTRKSQNWMNHNRVASRSIRKRPNKLRTEIPLFLLQISTVIFTVRTQLCHLYFNNVLIALLPFTDISIQGKRMRLLWQNSFSHIYQIIIRFVCGFGGGVGLCILWFLISKKRFHFCKMALDSEPRELPANTSTSPAEHCSHKQVPAYDLQALCRQAAYDYRHS